MNRKILFKAKRKDNGEWIEGYYIADPDLDSHFIYGWNYYSENGINREPLEEEINPDTLCQYTGLLDKNSKKIWENDILTATLDMGEKESTIFAKIIWEKNGFYAKEIGAEGMSIPLDDWYSENFKVCGNIFDNPELLEVEE